MKKSEILVLVAVTAVGCALTWWLYKQGQERLELSSAALRGQREEMVRLREEQRQLAAGLAATTGASNAAAAVSPEIERLQAKHAALRQRLDEAGRATNQTVAAGPGPSASKQDPPKTPQYFEQLHRIAGARTRDAMALVAALRLYAEKHDGRAPDKTEDLNSYVGETGLPLSGTNRYEMLYSGSMEELSRVPSGALAVLRGTEVWTAPSGKPARVYGLSNGAAQIVESDDNFQSWEAKHVFRSGAGGGVSGSK